MKNTKKKKSRRADQLDFLDEANDCCKNITAVTELLKACGRHPGAEPVAAEVVKNAGYLIGQEIRRLAELIAGLIPSNRKPTERPE